MAFVTHIIGLLSNKVVLSCESMFKLKFTSEIFFSYADGVIGLAVLGGGAAIAVGALVGLGVALVRKK